MTVHDVLVDPGTLVTSNARLKAELGYIMIEIPRAEVIIIYPVRVCTAGVKQSCLVSVL